MKFMKKIYKAPLAKNETFEFADEINMNTDRGTGGFGSTGK